LRVLRWLLVFVPLALVARWGLSNDILTFVFAGIGLVPLAGLLGEATEELALRTGPKVGGLLNATLGNAAELIITIVALKAGKLELVKASIVGSILGNLLLILGFSLLVGGLRNGTQRFDRGMAGTSSTMMLLSVIGLLVPTLFEVVHRVSMNVPVVGAGAAASRFRDPSLESLTLGVSALLMTIYVLSLVHSFAGPERELVPVGVEETPERESHAPTWSLQASVAVLLVATAFTVLLSELLVGAVEPVVRTFGLSELFLGVVLIPLVGNVAEHLVAVQTAWKNKMDLSLAISLGSSMQIALFVAPLLTFVSLLFRERMTLFFDPFQVLVLGLAVLIAGQIAVDGESNWLEGAQLLAVYLMSALAFLYL
jgi:Ca2+:H+ antiporter